MVFRQARCVVGNGKTHRGETTALIKQSLCTNSTIISKSCTENVKYLTLKQWPFYLPRELQCIIVSNVYILPAAKEKAAHKMFHDMINEHENMYPDAAVIILGDFNHTNLKKKKPKLHQNVFFPSRGKASAYHYALPPGLFARTLTKNLGSSGASNKRSESGKRHFSQEIQRSTTELVKKWRSPSKQQKGLTR